MDWPFLKKDIQYILLNRIVCEIPSWHIRRLFYRLCGMKIHESARIGINTVIVSPGGIEIGMRSVINDNCCSSASYLIQTCGNRKYNHQFSYFRTKHRLFLKYRADLCPPFPRTSLKNDIVFPLEQNKKRFYRFIIAIFLKCYAGDHQHLLWFFSFYFLWCFLHHCLLCRTFLVVFIISWQRCVPIDEVFGVISRPLFQFFASLSQQRHLWSPTKLRMNP